MGLRPSGKRSRFLVTHANPLNVFTFANFLEHAIERIAHHSVNPFHASSHQRFDHHFRYQFLCHNLFRLGFGSFALQPGPDLFF